MTALARSPDRGLEAGDPEGDETIPPETALPASVVANTHQTSRTALHILLESDARYHAPTRQERLALQVGFAKHGKTLHGAAFDALRLLRPIDLADPDAIAAGLDAIEVHEIKSTNSKAMKADLKGYFFNITAGELLVAQSLGRQYRFMFVNTLTRELQELTLNEIFGRSRKIYPAWHIVL